MRHSKGDIKRRHSKGDIQKKTFKGRHSKEDIQKKHLKGDIQNEIFKRRHSKGDIQNKTFKMRLNILFFLFYLLVFEILPCKNKLRTMFSLALFLFPDSSFLTL